MTLKVVAVAITLGLMLAHPALPPLALAGGLSAVLAGMVFAERTLISGPA